MSHFEKLHPALQHHIVNSLGWRELRPFQEKNIPALLAGEHRLILAPTAGGKTEAAFFPILSRMLAEEWSGLTVLYICPIKALLNNLNTRLDRYCSMLGRKARLWHGDITASEKNRILQTHPDCLLTTPESIEVMLISSRVDAASLFHRLQAVIVDEIHAFAGDDRGWHLLSVLERVQRLAGRELQRVGLSATVGNPEALLYWLRGSSRRKGAVSIPSGTGEERADVKIDYVGTLQNAAVVISRLHRGEKRLVFVDSRARAEKLGADLRRREVNTFVSHSSLSQQQRRQTEEAFASGENCVIVATSALELGIDVGDLDRVIQIDAPNRVSSFLQRMGRTGRRKGSIRNCLFLATTDLSLVQAVGLVRMWKQGFIEPTIPPCSPYHIFSQQMMALALQEKGIGRHDAQGWIQGVPAFAGMPEEVKREIIQWMLEKEILWDDQGVVWLGRKGEDEFGRRYFMELFSVFVSPPLFEIRQGNNELGYVDDITFLGQMSKPWVILLGGRSWKVMHVDWRRRIAHVERSDLEGWSQWTGFGMALNFSLCQAMKQVLAENDHDGDYSKRTREQLELIRSGCPWIRHDSTSLIRRPDGEVAWWTFGGTRANASLSGALEEILGPVCKYNGLAVTFERGQELNTITGAVNRVRVSHVESIRPKVSRFMIDQLKFSQCLPDHIASDIMASRLSDDEAVRFITNQSVGVSKLS